MPDIPERAPQPPSEEERELQAGALEEVPGHTPHVAEGDDEDAPQREHRYPDPDKTPGRAEG
ncbi:hypothetical protein DRW03_26110 [Corallococcus sp. H22C18031201]|uniref:hypothetical protein n=1 Tax=Citreicoccus inhibens TaxID=2849499 RepID=UPI000E765DD9|nr:hypothetical protein [Citreicoccus inhibens]MBU8898151.1 hypothetical protein [Citreicoccus inhibens]RJS18034.1 hypothetical protein DRW03_26110 [Corallococcus sp. H22C18031201]